MPDMPAVAEHALVGVEAAQIVAAVVDHAREAPCDLARGVRALARAREHAEALDRVEQRRPDRRRGRGNGEHLTCPFGTRGAPVGPSRTRIWIAFVTPSLSRATSPDAALPRDP